MDVASTENRSAHTLSSSQYVLPIEFAPTAQDSIPFLGAENKADSAQQTNINSFAIGNVSPSLPGNTSASVSIPIPKLCLQMALFEVAELAVALTLLPSPKELHSMSFSAFEPQCNRELCCTNNNLSLPWTRVHNILLQRTQNISYNYFQ